MSDHDGISVPGFAYGLLIGSIVSNRQRRTGESTGKALFITLLEQVGVVVGLIGILLAIGGVDIVVTTVAKYGWAAVALYIALPLALLAAFALAFGLLVKALELSARPFRRGAATRRQPATKPATAPEYAPVRPPLEYLTAYGVRVTDHRGAGSERR